MQMSQKRAGTRGSRWKLASAVLALGALSASCSSETGEDDERSGEQIGLYEVGTHVGERGEHVRAVHDYLRSYGYLPNDELQKLDPSWVPAVSELPSDPEVFDETLER